MIEITPQQAGLIRLAKADEMLEMADEELERVNQLLEMADEELESGMDLKTSMEDAQMRLESLWPLRDEIRTLVKTTRRNLGLTRSSTSKDS